MLASPNKLLHKIQPKALCFWVFLLLFSAQFLCFGYLYYEASQNDHLHVREEVSNLALAASQLIDIEQHEQLTDPKQIDSELYQNLVRPLVRFHLVCPEIHYLYTMREDSEGNERFVLDTATQPEVVTMLLGLGRDAEGSTLLEEYEMPEGAGLEEENQAMRSGQAYVYEEIYEDEYGSFISAQAPLFTKDGVYVGYLGVDYSLQAYNDRLNTLKRAGLITTLLALVLSGYLAQIAYKMRVESINQLNLVSDKEEEVRKEKERAEVAVLAKTDLLSTAVHDLKNPLGAIQGLCDIILFDRETLKSEQLEYVERISKTSENMFEAITGILRNEGLEHTSAQRDEEVDLTHLAQSVVDFNIFSANRKGIRFETDLEPGVKLHGDAMRLREAMDNLVSNAVKYSPMKALIRVALAPVDSGKQVRFLVRDQGEGISEKEQEKLFQKFAKLSAKPTGGESSTGLGLSIVKTIVQQHGGTVGCTSELGKGSCFWIQLALTSD